MAESGASVPFVGSGIAQDLHLLYNKFAAHKSNAIRDFADVFRQMHFEKILHYRFSPHEYIEFAEYLFQSAVAYFADRDDANIPRTNLERIFGIYCCYALYSLQPCDHVCQIPVTNLQFESLMKFQNFLEQEKVLEPLAALKNLIVKKAFRFIVFTSSYDPATHKKCIAEEELPNFDRKPIEPFARVREIQNLKSMSEMTYIHNQYVEAKKRVGLGHIQLVDKVNVVEDIEKHLEKHKKLLESKQNGTEESQTDSQKKLPESAGSSRSALRSRAYAAEMKHTRQRRYLDPKMEENFKNVTFGQIARECLEEEPGTSADTPGTSSGPRKPKRKRVYQQEEAPLEGHELAEQVLRDEYANRVKPEVPENRTDDIEIGGPRSRSKLRAPNKKNPKLVEVKTERRTDPTEPPEQHLASFKSPEKKPKRLLAQPPISNEWASRLHAWKGGMEATDKQMKKLASRIKKEPVEERSE